MKVDIVTSDDVKIYFTGKFQNFSAGYIIKLKTALSNITSIHVYVLKVYSIMSVYDQNFNFFDFKISKHFFFYIDRETVSQVVLISLNSASHKLEQHSR